MTAVTASTSPQARLTPSLNPDVGGTGESLLVPPSHGQYGVITEIYSVMAASNKLNAESSMQSIRSASTEREEAWSKHINHLESALQERGDGGFWGELGDALGKVASVAAVAGSVALAVASCGAGTPLAVLAISGAAMSVAGAAQSEFGLLELAGMDQDTASKIGLGLSLGGAACSLGAGVIGMAGLAGSGVGAAAQGAHTAQKLGQGAVIVGGLAGIGAGVATVVNADYQRDALRHDANATAALYSAQQLQQQLMRYIDELKHSKEADARNLERAVSMTQTTNATMLAVAGGKG